MNISITKRAWEKLFSIARGDKIRFLLSAKSGGCNGYIYNITKVEEDARSQQQSFVRHTAKKTIILVNDNISVLIEPRSELLLANTIVDYDKGQYDERFIFNNTDDGKKSKCGCGKSFSM
jgi:iron-sulfur cluster assembly accessory protein